MGKIRHLDEVKRFAEATPVFRLKDIEMIVGDRSYAAVLLHRMEKRRQLVRVTKGWYSRYDDPAVAVFSFKPAYLGLQNALSVRNMWEQETNVVIVSTRRIRTGLRRMTNANVVLHRIEQRYFFGYEFVRQGDYYVPVSDLEKTLIDLVYFGEFPGREELREALGRVNKEKIARYLREYPERFRNRVMSIYRLRSSRES